jgi:hypothetical protein
MQDSPGGQAQVDRIDVRPHDSRPFPSLSLSHRVAAHYRLARTAANQRIPRAPARSPDESCQQGAWVMSAGGWSDRIWSVVLLAVFFFVFCPLQSSAARIDAQKLRNDR